MAEHQVRGDRAVYDIETEEPRGTRRRQPAADWGVSEEIFDRMPSPRRRFRPNENPPARRESHPRRFEPARDDAWDGDKTWEAGAEARTIARSEPAPAFQSLDERRSGAPREARRRDLEAVRAAAAREAAEPE